MSTAAKTPAQGAKKKKVTSFNTIHRSPSTTSLSRSSSTPEVFCMTPDSERGGGAGGDSEGKIQTSSAPLTEKEEQALDELARLFTIQEERCRSEMEQRREGSKLSKASLTSSQLAEASFIYQHVNFQILSKCVPSFVKTNINKNGRYLPETFILRVNYWRRRRALGEDSGAKRAAKETAARTCGTDQQATSTPRAASSKTARQQTGSGGTAGGAATNVSRQASTMSSHVVPGESRITMISG
ncbi:uncharacterized protein [Littorina saxatilis]|uniref:Uncharacterized protein n=1 Tax=Littorina saxatilis TaxID=31220 RepID=A0AAN9BN37_9CAEN